MVMMGRASTEDWGPYIETLLETGKFRGGSSLGNGVAVAKGASDGECQISGYMRFSADNIDEVRQLLAGNPLYEAGGCVELLEEIID